MSNEENFSNDFIQNIMFSEYAKNLESLRNHVVGLKVLDSIVGNRGFILKLENDKWAAAFRKDNSILHDFSNEKISNEILEIINSTDY